MQVRSFAIIALVVAASSAGAQITGGQIDKFPTSTMGWQGAAPAWVSTGGPAGAGDGFLRLTSNGAGGPGGKMAGYNSIQWAGNYLAAGVTSIAVDFHNLGPTSLEMRLVMFDIGTTTQWVSNSSVILPTGSAWTHAIFAFDEPSFTRTQGTTSFHDTIVDANRIMFRHDPGAPSNNGVSISGILGIDNVQAVPEPLSLLGLTAASAWIVRRRKKAA